MMAGWDTLGNVWFKHVHKQAVIPVTAGRGASPFLLSMQQPHIPYADQTMSPLWVTSGLPSQPGIALGGCRSLGQPSMAAAGLCAIPCRLPGGMGSLDSLVCGAMCWGPCSGSSVLRQLQGQPPYCHPANSTPCRTASLLLSPTWPLLQ